MKGTRTPLRAKHKMVDAAGPLPSRRDRFKYSGRNPSIEMSTTGGLPPPQYAEHDSES